MWTLAGIFKVWSIRHYEGSPWFENLCFLLLLILMINLWVCNFLNRACNWACNFWDRFLNPTPNPPPPPPPTHPPTLKESFSLAVYTPPLGRMIVLLQFILFFYLLKLFSLSVTELDCTVSIKRTVWILGLVRIKTGRLQTYPKFFIYVFAFWWSLFKGRFF